MTSTIQPRLRVKYNTELRAQLKETLELGNIMEVPRLEKIVLNVGAGKALEQKQIIERVVTDLTVIAGQRPVVTKAKKSIAGFKLREGNPIGVKVSAGADVDDLLRVRDFRGLNPKSFDGRGNYTFGVTEQLIFPEIDYDKVDTSRGMDISIVTTARTDAEGKALLDAFGFPFRREGQ